MRSTLGLVVLLAAGLGAAACATGRAQIPEQPPTLVVPPVPPRAIEPPAVVEPPVEPPPVEPAPPPPAATTKQGKPRAAIEPKPDPKQEPPPDVVATVPPPVAPLRTPATPTGQEAVRQIKEILESTLKLLDKVDEPQLSDDRKANLTSARAFIQQAEEALKKKPEELTLARSLAERAQNIAKLLTSR